MIESAPILLVAWPPALPPRSWSYDRWWRQQVLRVYEFCFESAPSCSAAEVPMKSSSTRPKAAERLKQSKD